MLYVCKVKEKKQIRIEKNKKTLCTNGIDKIRNQT